MRENQKKEINFFTLVRKVEKIVGLKSKFWTDDDQKIFDKLAGKYKLNYETGYEKYKKQEEKMKNYVSMDGVAEQPVYHTLTSGAIVVIKYNERPIPYNNKHVVVEIAEIPQGCQCPIPIGGRACTILTAEIKNKIEAEKERAINELLTKCPGLDELLGIINNDENYYEATQCALDRGDGFYPSRPEGLTPNEAREKYPESAAYLQLLSLSEADPSSRIGYIRCCAGDTGLESMRAGGTPVDCLAAAMVEIETQTHTAEYRNYVAGL